MGRRQRPCRWRAQRDRCPPRSWHARSDSTDAEPRGAAVILRNPVHQRRQENRVVSPATARAATVTGQLREIDDTENRNVKYAMQVLATPVASVGQNSRADSPALVRAPMTQQVHRIVLRHADQRESECERDAMHGTEQRAAAARPASPALASGMRARCYRCDRRSAAAGSCPVAALPRALRFAARALFHHHRKLPSATDGHLHMPRCGGRRRARARRADDPDRMQPRFVRAVARADRCDRTTRRTRASAPASAASLAAASAFERRIARQPRLQKGAGGDARSRRAPQLCAEPPASSAARSSVGDRRKRCGQQALRTESSANSPFVTAEICLCPAGSRPARAKRLRDCSGGAPSSAIEHARAGPSSTSSSSRRWFQGRRARQEQPQVGADDQRRCTNQPRIASRDDPCGEQQRLAEWLQAPCPSQSSFQRSERAALRDLAGGVPNIISSRRRRR